MCNDINSIPSLSATWSEEKKYIKDTRVYAHNSLNKRGGHENYTSGFYLKQDLVYLAENNISTGLFATYPPPPPPPSLESTIDVLFRHFGLLFFLTS